MGEESIISHIKQLEAKTWGVMSEFEVCSTRTEKLSIAQL